MDPLQERVHKLQRRAEAEGQIAPIKLIDIPELVEMASPLVRKSDPVTSHIGAGIIEPKRSTRKGQVLAVLRASDWVSGHDLCTHECGGSEGLRRLRELRAEGWPVETRFVGDVAQYRLR
jgi:hypothetical protein